MILRRGRPSLPAINNAGRDGCLGRERWCAGARCGVGNGRTRLHAGAAGSRLAPRAGGCYASGMFEHTLPLAAFAILTAAAGAAAQAPAHRFAYEDLTPRFGFPVAEYRLLGAVLGRRPGRGAASRVGPLGGAHGAIRLGGRRAAAAGVPDVVLGRGGLQPEGTRGRGPPYAAPPVQGADAVGARHVEPRRRARRPHVVREAEPRVGRLHLGRGLPPDADAEGAERALRSRRHRDGRAQHPAVSRQCRRAQARVLADQGRGEPAVGTRTHRAAGLGSRVSAAAGRRAADAHVVEERGGGRSRGPLSRGLAAAGQRERLGRAAEPRVGASRVAAAIPLRTGSPMPRTSPTRAST